VLPKARRSATLALAAAATPGQDPGKLAGRVYAANTAGAIVGAATYLAMGFRTFGMNGAIRVAIALVIGCVLGIAAERLQEVLGRMKVVPAMSHRG